MQGSLYTARSNSNQREYRSSLSRNAMRGTNPPRVLSEEPSEGRKSLLDDIQNGACYDRSVKVPLDQHQEQNRERNSRLDSYHP